MDEILFARVAANSKKLIADASQYKNRRYLYRKVKSAPDEYFVGVCGLRGVGKTVLLQQLASEAKNPIYFSADASYLGNEDLYEIARFLSSRGYRNLFVDEIHAKKNWTACLKTIYDEGLARVVFSGSSALDIGEGADLSRRALIYRLNPLSFREYLAIKKGFAALGAVAPSELFDQEKRKAVALRTAQFNDYLGEYFRMGGVFYESGSEEHFREALKNSVNKIIHTDLGYLRNLNADMENEIHRLLEWIAISPPGETSYSGLSGKLSLSKPTLIRVIDDLAKIGLVLRLRPCGKNLVRKDPKLYLAFPFREYFAASVLRQPDRGALREEFFVNHVPQTCYLKGRRGEKTPDFMLGGKRVEVGGEGKNLHQDPDFVFKEGIAFDGKSIPLYLAGFLY